MKKIVLAVVVCVFGLAGALSAEETSNRALAEELLTHMKMQKNLEDTYEMIKEMQISRVQQMGVAMGEPADKTRAVSQKVMDIMSQEMSWDKMKGDYITIYEETFTAEELSGMIEFYKSPVGQKSIEKQPEIMEKSMKVNKKKMDELMPKLQRVVQEMRQEAGGPGPGPEKQGIEPQ